MKLLLVEDDKAFGSAFQAFLTEQGHQVTWLRSVESLDPFTGVDGSGEKVVVKVADYQLALVDGQLDKSAFQGPEIAAQLSAQDLKVLGVSTVGDLNEEMVSLGAIAAANKAVAFIALFSGKLGVDDIVNGVVDAKEFLQGFFTEVRNNAQLRRGADEFLRPYLC